MPRPAALPRRAPMARRVPSVQPVRRVRRVRRSRPVRRSRSARPVRRARREPRTGARLRGVRRIHRAAAVRRRAVGCRAVAVVRAGRPARLRRHVVGDHRQPRGARVERRPAGEQRARVGVLRGAEDVADRPLLAHAALAHHHHAVGDLADDAEVVADEQHAHAPLGLQAREQVEDLALDGHVERGGRLVGDEQLRLAGERHGDHDALLLAARQLVRIGAQAPPRLGQADLGEQFLGARQGLPPAQPQVQGERLAELVGHAQHRVERAHRVLEHAGDVAAAQRAQRGRRRREQVAPLEGDAARALGVVGQQADEGHGGDALARARLADQRHRGVGGDVEGDAVDRLHAARPAALGAEAERHAQVGDGQQRRAGRGGGRAGAHSSPRSFGSSASRRASVKSEKAVTKTAMKAVAAASCHQWPRISSPCASASMVPHDTCSTPTPRPR